MTVAGHCSTLPVFTGKIVSLAILYMLQELLTLGVDSDMLESDYLYILIRVPADKVNSPRYIYWYCYLLLIHVFT